MNTDGHRYGDFRLPELPYGKSDGVAKMHAVRKPAKPKPMVPASHCDISDICSLRKSGKCLDVYCDRALQYLLANEEKEGRR